MKKVIKLTETDLENIVKKVLFEQNMGVAFGSVGNGLTYKNETKEQDSVDGRPELINRWNQLFPNPAWYNGIRTRKLDFENFESLNDPELQKMYDVYRLFIDPNVPQISQSTIDEFYEWLEKTMNEATLHNVRTKFIDDVKRVNELQRGMIPVLKMSNYPNTDPYETAFRKAIRIDQDMKTNRYYSAIHPVSKKAYQYIIGK
jgi:hypothetical protein